ncbi:J domain-containing protein [Halococcus agarilyticus]|uniref:J domain-containing protein n=1 Tax=Halococcus agarilyticus TaxID=1232219 RepID=UPI00067833A4|nr:J domain-containing protein [Halococcus agarilyticus]
MTRSRLVIGLGAVFAGLTVLTTVLGFVYSPVALALAAAFGVTTYFLWYHASGRLRRRVHRDARAAGSGRAKSTARTRTDGFGAGPREGRTGPRERRGFDAGRSRRRDVGGRRRQAGPSTAEAYRTLGLEPGADETAVRSAYREKVKEVHPDADDGSERAFKRVQSAYDHLSD